MPEPVILHPGRPENPKAEEYAQFLDQTKDHELVVLHDYGLYRHLRIQKPGTHMWSWDIITWPGHLATSGDVANGYTFAREPDMIDFFSYAGVTRDYYSDGAPSIDMRYWNEKLQGQRDDTRVYDEREFLRQVREALDESEETNDEAQALYERQIALVKKLHELRGLTTERSEALVDQYALALYGDEAIRSDSPWSAAYGNTEKRLAEAKNELWDLSDLDEKNREIYFALDDYDELHYVDLPSRSPADKRAALLKSAKEIAADSSEEDVHEWLSEHEDDLGVSDTWEWDLRVWDWSFVNACWCIDLAVRKYQELRRGRPAPDDYVVLEGGVVQNDPAVPVFDLDIANGPEGVEEAVGLRERVLAHPRARRAMEGDVRELELFVRHFGGPEDASFPEPPLRRPDPSNIIMEESL